LWFLQRKKRQKTEEPDCLMDETVEDFIARLSEDLKERNKEQLGKLA